MTSNTSLFVTNNGLSDHIGIAQILPYLEGLSRRGYRMVCLSVEDKNKQHIYDEQVAPRLLRAGIMHHPIYRHIMPVAHKVERFWIPNRLTHHLDLLVQKYDARIIHCRSYMPLQAALQVSAKRRVPLIFDMRGFWIDERLDAGLWNGPLGHITAKHFRKYEQKAYATADAIVTLTHDARAEVLVDPAYGGAQVSVIPCSVKQSLFRPRLDLTHDIRTLLGIEETDIVLAHLGSAGPLYRMDATYKLAAKIEELGVPVRIMMIGRHDVNDHVRQAHLAGADLQPHHFRCLEVDHDEVPALLSTAQVGLSFRIPSRSSLGVSATKVGEYLACGLPVISNHGIGDIHRILQDPGVGHVLPDLSENAIAEAAQRLVTTNFHSRMKIRATGREFFDMDHAILSYDALYRQFIQPNRMVA